jgi:hypothetical protein
MPEKVIFSFNFVWPVTKVIFLFSHCLTISYNFKVFLIVLDHFYSFQCIKQTCMFELLLVPVPV